MMDLENIAIIGSELVIRWSDGQESYLRLSELRKACPCASCQGEPDALGRVVKPAVELNEKSVQLQRYEFVGGYALQPYWADGHGTGIYSYEYLRGLAGAAGA